MKRILLLSSFLVLLFAIGASAQTITTTTCPGVGCINFPTAGQGTIGIQITGTWVGTITFQGTIDNTNYVSINVTPTTSSTTVSTTTGNGVWTTAVAGLTQVRVVFTAWTSGTATVIGRTTVTTKNSTGGGGGGGSGTVTSIATTSPITGGTITTTGTIACATCAVMGGSNTQVLFNDSSAIGGSAGLVFDKTHLALTVDGTAGTSGVGDTSLNVYRYNSTGGGQVIYAEGDLADAAAGQFKGIVVDVGNVNGTTLPLLTGLSINGNYVSGAGSAVTTNIGLNIASQTAGATNYAIKTGSGLIDFNGLSYPTTDGTAGQYIATDGAGTLSFTTPATTVVNNIKFNNGKGIQTNIVANDTVLFQAYDNNDATYRTFATLTAGNTPDFSIVTPSGGTLAGDFSSLKINGVAVTAGGSVLSGITAASGANTIANGNNVQTWNWANTTAASQSFVFGETTAAINGGAAATTTQAILSAKTLASSTALPLFIENAGGAPSLRINDSAGDTTPVCVDSGGFLGIGTCGPVDLLTVVGTGGYEAEINDGTRRYGFYVDATIGGFGTISNHPLSFFTGNSQPRITLTTGGVTRVWRQQTPATSIGTGATGLTNEYLQVGGDEAVANGYFNIGFGYSGGTTVPPAYIGFQEISNTSNTFGDIVLGTRSVTTDTAPSERLRIDNQGTLIIPSTSPVPAVSNTSANSCGTTAATIAGNNNIGTITVGATSGTSCTVTFTTTAPVAWVCMVENQTTTNAVQATPSSTTVSIFKGTMVAGDKLDYVCFAR